MTNDEKQHVIDELQALINDTQATLSRFEQEGMEDEMPEDYQALLDILDDAIKQQCEHTQGMLG